MVHSPRPSRPGITSDGPPLWAGSAEKPRPDTRTMGPGQFCSRLLAATGSSANSGGSRADFHRRQLNVGAAPVFRPRPQKKSRARRDGPALQLSQRKQSLPIQPGKGPGFFWLAGILWEARTASSAAEGEQWPLRNTKDIGLKRPKPLANGARRLAVRIVWTSGSEVAGISSLGRGRIQRSVRRWNAHTNLSTLTR